MMLPTGHKGKSSVRSRGYRAKSLRKLAAGKIRHPFLPVML
jgi:hypothetical protein